MEVFRGLAPSPAKLTGKPCGPFMVELFTPAGFAGSARSGTPVPPVARLEAPHASQVKRTERLESPGQDFAPALKHDGPGF